MLEQAQALGWDGIDYRVLVSPPLTGFNGCWKLAPLSDIHYLGQFFTDGKGSGVFLVGMFYDWVRGHRETNSVHYAAIH